MGYSNTAAQKQTTETGNVLSGANTQRKMAAVPVLQNNFKNKILLTKDNNASNKANTIQKRAIIANPVPDAELLGQNAAKKSDYVTHGFHMCQNETIKDEKKFVEQSHDKYTDIVLLQTSNRRTKVANAALEKELQKDEKKQNPQLIIQLTSTNPKDELPLQGKFTIQKTAKPDEEPPLQTKPNTTGLPDNLKSGVENLSGFSMDDVKVHYNSSKPAQLQALAYAQGSDIHVAPGQEQHLPHEAWHVVQQKQGRVQPTMQMKEGVAVNDDKGLESEADVMGGKAKYSMMQRKTITNSSNGESSTIQCVLNPVARSLAFIKGLNYDEIVLPALNTYLSKRHLVDIDRIRTIEDLSFKEYSNFLNELARRGDYTGKNFVYAGTWYRGIGFAHFSYRTFKETGGILCGEGLKDDLVWTMGGSSTRWLPGATEANICSCGALSTARFLINRPAIGGNPDIIGIIVRKDLSNDNPAWYQDNPASEAAIRGPQRVELAFLVNGTGDLIPFNNIANLPDPQ